MKLAFLYAGQGSQHVGMGADLYQQSKTFQSAFDTAVAPLSFDCKEICFTDKNNLLGNTEYTQPCMVAFAVALTAVLRKENIIPAVVAGLSLGEYSALHAAGVIDGAQAVSIVAARGKAMAWASEGAPCGMVAVLGIDAAVLEQCCQQAAQTKGTVVQICNYNCPGQLVIGGEAAAVAHCAELAKLQGAKRCIPLKVSGAFHTALMQPAGDALQALFLDVAFKQPQVPVLHNTLGRERTAADPSIAALLVQQVQSSVQMEASLRRLLALGVDTVIEIGPGRALSGFLKKTVGNAIVCYSVETMAELQTAIEAVKGGQ